MSRATRAAVRLSPLLKALTLSIVFSDISDIIEIATNDMITVATKSETIVLAFCLRLFFGNLLLFIAGYPFNPFGVRTELSEYVLCLPLVSR